MLPGWIAESVDSSQRIHDYGEDYFVGSDSRESRRFMVIARITSESIQAARTWHGQLSHVGLPFLENLNRLEEIEAESITILSDVELTDGFVPLHRSVKRLRLHGVVLPDKGKLRLPIDTSLVELDCSWSNIPSVEPWCSQLTWLRVTDMWAENLQWLKIFPLLQEIHIVATRRTNSYSGIAFLHDLKILDIYGAPQLSDASDLGLLGNLEELVLEGCRAVTDLGFLLRLPKLRYLDIGNAGHFDSATPIAALRELETLNAWGSTVFDDEDVSAIAQLTQLRSLNITNRRHYRPRLKSFNLDDDGSWDAIIGVT